MGFLDRFWAFMLWASLAIQDWRVRVMVRVRCLTCGGWMYLVEKKPRELLFRCPVCESELRINAEGGRDAQRKAVQEDER